VLPAFNAGRTLAGAIASVRGQTFPDWELVLVDDGSTDDTAALGAAAAREDPRIRYLCQPHRGIVAALDTGLGSARGEYLARLDADDSSPPDRLALQTAFLDRHADVGLVSGRVAFDGDARGSGGFARHVAWLNSLTTPEAIALNRFVEAPVAHPSVLFRRELLGRHGSYRDGPFPEDYELWLRWLDQGIRFAKVPATVLWWADRPDRLSRCDPRYARDVFYRVKAPYLARAIRRTLGGRELWIWGAGRVTRRRVGLLTDQGLTVRGFIDVDRKKWGRPRHGHLVVGPTHLPAPQQALVVGYVASLGARELIQSALEARGFVPGADSWLAA
jgi:glycosyltransferase involved in cell wall biosynthesis